MVKTDAEYKAAERARRREAGLQRFELWLHPKEWPAVKQFVERLAKRRNGK